MVSVLFQGKPLNITVIQVYAPTTNAEEAEAEQFYEDVQNLLKLTPKKDVLFLTGDSNAKVGSQEIPRVTGKLGLEVENEAEQRLGKIRKEMGILDHLTCLLRNLYVGQEATVRTRHGTTGCFQIEKGICQGCILNPCLFNLYAEYILRNSHWKKHKLESILPGEISITSDMQMTPPLWQKVKRN